jgi:hypothetical protein
MSVAAVGLGCPFGSTVHSLAGVDIIRVAKKGCLISIFARAFCMRFMIPRPSVC